MLIRMKESKGFTLVELMIVVAIIGILAAVAVPFYQRYIQKSRLTSMVFPGVHSIETNIGTYYSLKNEFPTGTTASAMVADADTECYTVSLTSATLSITLTDTTTRCKALSNLVADGGRLEFAAKTVGGKITSWVIGSSTLSLSLGLAGEGD